MKNFETEYIRLTPEFFEDVQKRYGDATPKEWEMAELDYDENNGPAITYPLGYMMDIPRQWKYHVTLHPSAKNDYDKGIFQLSHESVHRLCPTGDNITNNLEEGVAVEYSRIALEKFAKDKEYFEKAIASAAKTGYPYAYELVRQLLVKFPNAIKDLREKEGQFTNLTKVHFIAAEIAIDDSLIDQLLEDFLEYRPTTSDVAAIENEKIA